MTSKTPVQEAYEELAVVLWPITPPGTLVGTALAKYEAAIRADERVRARELVAAAGAVVDQWRPGSTGERFNLELDLANALDAYEAAAAP